MDEKLPTITNRPIRSPQNESTEASSSLSSRSARAAASSGFFRYSTTSAATPAEAAVSVANREVEQFRLCRIVTSLMASR